MKIDTTQNVYVSAKGDEVIFSFKIVLIVLSARVIMRIFSFKIVLIVLSARVIIASAYFCGHIQE